VTVDSAGNIFIADTTNERIRKVSVSNGTITTVAGNGNQGSSGDGGPATSASLSVPYGMAADSAGNLYIADTDNSRIRKVSNGTITTVVGNGFQGFSGDGGPATSASLYLPTGVAADSAGNLYISDAVNNRIRKVSGGTITTFAGNGGYRASGDGGPAAIASLDEPLGVAVDSAGNLYIADGNNRIRKVSNGTITTVAGDGVMAFSGDGVPATSASLQPSGVAVDSAGNLYIADAVNQRIRKVSNGTIATVAGNGNKGFSGDGGPATSASLNFPGGSRRGFGRQPLHRRHNQQPDSEGVEWDDHHGRRRWSSGLFR
jgi:sugar lactone lactonase YvrE